MSPSPSVAGHVEVGAQRPPHLARVDAVLDGLGRRPPESGQHMVHQQRCAADRTELSLDELVEFGQPHAPNLPSGRPGGGVAHLHRIGHAGHTLRRPPRGVPV